MFIETTHTPSGDENGESDSRCLASTRNNLRPVRGRKSGIDLHCAVQIAKQLTPRQGDERSSVPVTVGITPRNNSHPARGRKLLIRFWQRHPRIETTYTPSGDENQTFATKHPVICFEITYTPSGDENHFRTLYGYNAVRIETTYAPPGDENSS